MGYLGSLILIMPKASPALSLWWRWQGFQNPVWKCTSSPIFKLHWPKYLWLSPKQLRLGTIQGHRYRNKQNIQDSYFIHLSHLKCVKLISITSGDNGIKIQASIWRIDDFEWYNCLYRSSLCLLPRRPILWGVQPFPSPTCFPPRGRSSRGRHWWATLQPLTHCSSLEEGRVLFDVFKKNILGSSFLLRMVVKLAKDSMCSLLWGKSRDLPSITSGWV